MYFGQCVEFATTYPTAMGVTLYQEVCNMTTTANITLIKNEFIATLSDGRHIERGDLRELAGALAGAGLHACDVSFE